MPSQGIHHVTAIAGAADRNLAFYTEALGMRLVKKTVNFDDPGMYHFYYGDEAGQPGTILTFFPMEGVAPGRAGIGGSQETLFQVPEKSLGFWIHRFLEKGIEHEAPVKRFGETVLAFRDPDGTRLALAAVAGTSAGGWSAGGVPAEHAIRGLHGVSLLVENGGPTAAILTDVFGFTPAGSEGSTARYRSEGATNGGIVDVRSAGGFLPARSGAGSVHHVAFRAADDAAQAAMVAQLEERFGIVPTEQKDRNYFRSVYFREPGGVLFEIATDQPGFATDEPADRLGESLKLPAFLEPRRGQIEARLPALA